MKKLFNELIPLDKENNFLKVELYYSLGGYNYFTYKEEPRGYYLSATPVEREEKYGCVMESVVAFSGIKQCIVPCSRQSKKREAEALEKMGGYKDELVAEVLAKNGLKVA